MTSLTLMHQQNDARSQVCSESPSWLTSLLGLAWDDGFGRSAEKASWVVPLPCSRSSGSPDPAQAHESQVVTPHCYLLVGRGRRHSTQGVYRHADSTAIVDRSPRGQLGPRQEHLPASVPLRRLARLPAQRVAH